MKLSLIPNEIYIDIKIFDFPNYQVLPIYLFIAEGSIFIKKYYTFKKIITYLLKLSLIPNEINLKIFNFPNY